MTTDLMTRHDMVSSPGLFKRGRKTDERNEEPSASRWDTSLRIWME